MVPDRLCRLLRVLQPQREKHEHHTALVTVPQSSCVEPEPCISPARREQKAKTVFYKYAWRWRCWLVLGAASSEAQPSVRHVLVLQSFDRGNLTLDSFTNNVRAELGPRALKAPSTSFRSSAIPPGLVGASEEAIVDYIRSTFVAGPQPDRIIDGRRSRGSLRAQASTATGSRTLRSCSGPSTSDICCDAPLGREREAAVAVDNRCFATSLMSILQLLPETRQLFLVTDADSAGSGIDSSRASSSDFRAG